ncbi:unnamed protein product [Phaeothamnion confervicola]
MATDSMAADGMAAVAVAGAGPAEGAALGTAAAVAAAAVLPAAETTDAAAATEPPTAAGAAGTAMEEEEGGNADMPGSVAAGAAAATGACGRGPIGLPPVAADVVVAFYPTRYDVESVARGLRCPTIALFAEHDSIPGATIDDAQALQKGLAENSHVRDYMVRVFRGEKHGFAHRPGPVASLPVRPRPAAAGGGGEATGGSDMTGGGGRDGGGGGGVVAQDNAQDAMLLATAWLDIYLQKRHRTAGRRAKSSNADAFLI